MRRILVVDDEEPIRAMLKRVLSLHDFTVDTACDGDEAFDRLQTKGYDLMIIDRLMPKMSGVDAVAALRTSRRFDALKILMLTGDGLMSDVEEAFNKGVNGYILKPFDMNGLLTKVEYTLMT